MSTLEERVENSRRMIAELRDDPQFIQTLADVSEQEPVPPEVADVLRRMYAGEFRREAARQLYGDGIFSDLPRAGTDTAAETRPAESIRANKTKRHRRGVPNDQRRH